MIEGEATFDERLNPGFTESVLRQQREAPLFSRHVHASGGGWYAGCGTDDEREREAESVRTEQNIHLNAEVCGQIYLDGGPDSEVRALGDRCDSCCGGVLYYVLKGGTSQDADGKRLGACEEGQGQEEGKGPHALKYDVSGYIFGGHLLNRAGWGIVQRM